MSGDLDVTTGSSQTISVDSVLLGGDQIGDFTGTGLAMSSGSLTASLGTGVDSAEIVDGALAIEDMNWDYEYVYLTQVHGFGRALSDSIYLIDNIETPNGDTTYLLRDSAGNITANDEDTVNVAGAVPYNCTLDSLEIFYRINSASSPIKDNWLRGPDKSTFTNLTDSIWFGPNTTDLVATSWTTQLYTLSSTAALAGYRFGWKYIITFAADNDRLQIGWVRLRVKRTG
jgi:hypothetical protein